MSQSTQQPQSNSQQPVLSDVTILENVMCVYLEIDVPTGRRNNLAADLKLEGDQVPPANLMSLGQKQTFPTALVTPLNTCRKQAERALTSRGTRFMGGYAVPLKHIEEVMAEVRVIEQSFYVAADQFFTVYDQEVALWAANAGEWAHALKEAAPKLAEIKRKTLFTYRVAALKGLQASSEHAPPIADSLMATTLHEVAVEAAQVWRDTIDGRGELRTSTRNVFVKMRDKLDAMSFLRGGMVTLVQRVDEVLLTIPQLKGEKIAGSALRNLQGLCLLLKDEQAINDLVEAAERQSDLSGFFALPAVASQQPDAPKPQAQLPLAVNAPAAATAEAATAVSQSTVVAIEVPTAAAAGDDTSSGNVPSYVPPPALDLASLRASVW